MRTHPVIHVNNLKPFHPDDEDQQRNQVTRPSVTMKDSSTKEVEEILAERIHRIGKPKQLTGVFSQVERTSRRRNQLGMC